MRCFTTVLSLSSSLVLLGACSTGSGDDDSATTFATTGEETGDEESSGDEVGTETETETTSGETETETETSGETETETETSGGVCGDGQVDEGEACDLGAQNSDTGECTVDCALAVCGDGFIQDGVEDCDDGGESGACDADCSSVLCGDGVVNMSAGETCDDGNMDDTDACVGVCVAAVCGDGFVWADNEVCDDGNDIENDACSSMCVPPAGSCKDILAAVPDAENGLYVIDPDGEGPGAAIEVFCDMSTDGGGWTLILNRVVDSDNLGQADLDASSGTPDLPRATNWQFDIALFWADAESFVFADKENADCPDCAIADYDAAIKVPRPNAGAWSKACPGSSGGVDVEKLVGPPGNGQAFQCGASLGWGSCSGSVCHYGVHSTDTAGNGSWSQNGWNEMHFPSSYSSYASYGDVDQSPSAWCRSCGGGQAGTVNQSTTCCNNSDNNARSRWTLWVR